MKRFLILLLALILSLGTLVSCGAADPSDVPGSSEGNSSGNEASQTLEPITEVPDTADPFEGADPLPADLAIPEAVKSADGTVIGTIVLPAGSDATETTAAEELRYHIQKVTGADLPVVGRPGEDYGSLIVCSPASLPAIAELFPDDLAWLADTGDPEAGARWGSDGFAIRTLGKDIYIFGNVTRGTLNGAYDWIEENLGVLWVRADEELGLLYDEQPEVTVSKTDYREKSPFEIRGWMPTWSPADTRKMWSRNKLNFFSECPLYDIQMYQEVKYLITSSPLYDPEETEYWNTDEAGNRLTAETSPQINFWSDKCVEAVAASCVVQLQSGASYAFVGEQDLRDTPRNYPEDTTPFEYEPGQFVQPDAENYVSMVFYTFINKVARRVAELYPGGKIATYTYLVGVVPPECGIDGNILLINAPIDEDMTCPILSDAVKEKTKLKNYQLSYCDWIPAFSEKTKHISFWNYYGCSIALAQYTRPIWDRIQTDFQGYVSLGLEGVHSQGDGDCAGVWDYVDPNDDLWPYHSWNMNGLTYWLYSKLAWNPWEDVDALIELYCDRFYGEASAPMQEYYRQMKLGWDTGVPEFRQAVEHMMHQTQYYIKFVKNTGIGHPALDALEEAYEKASGPVKEVIGYMRDTFAFNMNSFKNW